MLSGPLGAQSLGMEREMMPTELEAKVKETVGPEVDAIIILGMSNMTNLISMSACSLRKNGLAIKRR